MNSFGAASVKRLGSTYFTGLLRGGEMGGTWIRLSSSRWLLKVSPQVHRIVLLGYGNMPYARQRAERSRPQFARGTANHPDGDFDVFQSR